MCWPVCGVSASVGNRLRECVCLGVRDSVCIRVSVRVRVCYCSVGGSVGNRSRARV